MGWDNGEDNNYDNQRRRKYRDRFSADEDAFGAADAEDIYDDGSAEDLSFGQHAAGFDRDYQYDQPYEDRQNYQGQGYDNSGAYNPNQPGAGYDGNQPYSGSPGWQNQPLDPTQVPNRASELRDRMAHRPNVTSRSVSGDSTGIDGLFDAKIGMPCTMNAVLVMLVILIALLVCVVMAVLAAGSLQRLLGI
ncbi:MAG TPA: hypothetical protein VJZ27_05345 [Aggregatilineales bacterium]|nr:hypothetical protein [Aggregatilineales bacterium]